MSGAAVQPFVLTATDSTGPAFAAIAAHMRALSAQMAQVQGQASRASDATMWSRMGKAVAGVHASMGGLSGLLTRTAGAMATVMAPIAALGGLGAVGGLFTMTANVAKASAEFQKLAKVTGLAPAELGRFNFFAKMSEVSSETLGNSLARLNLKVGEAASGKNKDAAKLFAALGISLRDGNGQVKKMADLLPDIFEAFRVNKSSTSRAIIGNMLFGKSWREIVPLLETSRESLTRWEQEWRELKWTPPPGTREALSDYRHEWLKLEYASTTFSRVLAGTLAKTLTPVIGQMTEWVTANREFIAMNVADAVKGVAEWLGKIEWKEAINGVGEFGRKFRTIVDDINGMKWFFGAMAAMQVVQFARSNPMLAGMAAVAAMGFAGYKLTDYYQKSGGEPMIPGTPGAPDSYENPLFVPQNFAVPPQLPTPSPPSAAPSGGYSWSEMRRNFSRRMFGLPPLDPASGGKVQVEINITGAPPGTDANVAYEGNVMPPSLTFDTGRAFSPMPGLR